MIKKLLNSNMIMVLVVLLVLLTAVVYAGEERTDASGQWKYVLQDDSVTVMGCVKNPSGDLAIPFELDGYPVTRIGYDAFSLCFGLTGVTIPEGITSIGYGAFRVVGV